MKNFRFLATVQTLFSHRKRGSVARFLFQPRKESLNEIESKNLSYDIEIFQKAKGRKESRDNFPESTNERKKIESRKNTNWKRELNEDHCVQSRK